jgi:hypothetical protein
MVYHSIGLNLNKTQIKNLIDGKGVRCMPHKSGIPCHVTKTQMAKFANALKPITFRMSKSQLKKQGSGFFDFIKSAAKSLAPVAIDALSGLAKDKIAGSGASGGRYNNEIFNTGKARLAKRGPPLFQNDVFNTGANKQINESDTSKDMQYNNDVYNTGPYRRRGASQVEKKAEKAAKAIKELHQVSGEGFFDIFKGIAKSVAPALLDMGTSALKDKISGGKIKRTAKGGSFMPIG